VDETVGWRLPADKKPYGNGRIGDLDCAGPTWAFEVSVDTLAKAMRTAYRECSEVKKRGSAAYERVKDKWTWNRSAESALTRLEALAELPAVRRELPVFAVAAPAAPAHSSKSKVKPTRHAPKKEHRVRPELRKPPTISLCMIVKNEERVLDDCLTSIKPWVDEIVIVDTGSTDKPSRLQKSTEPE